MSSRDTTPKKKKSRHKEVLEPISMDEILAGPGMSGFVSILDPPEAGPHLQALVDDIKDIPLLTVAEGLWKPRARGGEAGAEMGAEGSRLPKRAGNVIHLRRRDGEGEPPPTPEAERVPGAERDTGSTLPRAPA